MREKPWFKEPWFKEDSGKSTTKEPIDTETTPTRPSFRYFPPRITKGTSTGYR
jgi:hypothetical protein